MLLQKVNSIAPYSRPSCTLVSRGVGTRDSERRDRGMRRRRRRGDVVVLEESDESADEVQIMEPVPEGSQTTPGEPNTRSPAKKLIKCPICLDTASTFEKRNSQVVVTTCGHVFCSDCIRRSIAEQRRCPTCRKKLTVRQFHPLYLSL
jgi:hypothetical protein